MLGAKTNPVADRLRVAEAMSFLLRGGHRQAGDQDH